MRSQTALALGVIVFALSVTSHAQGPRRLNPMITLHEKGLPVLGITHPAIVAGRGRGTTAGAADAGARRDASAPPSLVDAARETMAYRFSDFAYNSYSTANADRFLGYMAALMAAGGSMSMHPFLSKVPIIHDNPEAATARIVEQLNAGHAGIILQEVESADEVRTALAAMRFKSKGGTRPDEGIGLAAAYWGLSDGAVSREGRPLAAQQERRARALGHRRKQEGHRECPRDRGGPGCDRPHRRRRHARRRVLDDRRGRQRVRDQAGFDAGVAAILAACKEFKVPCSYPANNPAEIEGLMARGFNVFTMQSRNKDGFDAIAAGRRLSGRPLPTTN